jgi:ketosteroid isomerase-like protein
MSQENVEIVRRGAEVFRTDLDLYVTEYLAPELEWYTAAEDPDVATHRGPQAFKAYVERWMDSFDGLRADLEECIDVGDDRVWTWVRWTGRGRASGANAEWHLAIVYTLRDGRIVRADEYFDRDEALEAVGLSKHA